MVIIWVYKTLTRQTTFEECLICTIVKRNNSITIEFRRSKSAIYFILKNQSKIYCSKSII